MLEVPPGFDFNDPDHYARLLLRLGQQVHVQDPDPLQVMRGLRLLLVPVAFDGLCGAYSLSHGHIYCASHDDGVKRRVVGHELGHIAMDLVQQPKPHDEAFIERIRIALLLPRYWVWRAVRTYGPYSPHVAHAFPLATRVEILRRTVEIQQHYRTKARRTG